MKKQVAIAVAIVGLVALGGIMFVRAQFKSFLDPEIEPEKMLQVTREWGRLAPLPSSAQEFEIRKEGSIFTRGFRASFKAPLGDIDRWLDESDGTRSVAPERPSLNVRHFNISPGGGAQHADVMVDDATGTVKIYVFWS